MSAAAAPVKKIVDAEKFDRTFVFKIRRHKDGSFKNLWSLSAKLEGQEPIEIVDADALDTCIDKIGFLFEQEGY
jgi:hypothetical protein